MTKVETKFYQKRLIQRVMVYSVIFGMALAVGLWDRANCEVDILETYVKIY